MNNVVNIIVGGAGFIGSNLVKRLISKENEIVYVIDNMSLGSRENIPFLSTANIFETDASIFGELSSAFSSIIDSNPFCDFVIWHLAANSDIQAGVNDLNVDLKDTFQSTVCILKIMETFNLSKINFASSSAIYGNQPFSCILESTGNLFPISSYGAMKLASEAVISASREKFLTDVSIFRFGNVIGLPTTHGILHDFNLKLKFNPRILNVLGDGSQQKPYIHVDELVDAMLHISSLPCNSNRLKVFNIAPPDDGVSVKDIAELFISISGCDAELSFGQESRGWIGDVPKYSFNVQALENSGWTAKMSSREAMIFTIKELLG